MALDEPKDDDQRIEQDGLRFLVGREVRMWLVFGKSVLVDYDDLADGFAVHLGGARCC